MSHDQFEKDIDLANAAAEFLRSDLARYIFDQAATVVDDCKAALVEADPEDTKEIRRLQEEIRRQNNLALWLQGIIHRGEQARQATAEEY